MQQLLKVAMPKGRINKSAIKLLQDAGYAIPDDLEDSRKLIISAPDVGMEFIMAKPVDVATYVEYGVSDIGIVAKMCLWRKIATSTNCWIWVSHAAGCRSSACRTRGR